MKYSFVVRSFDAGHNLAHDRRGSLWIDCALATQKVIESFTFDVFHHEKENAVSAFAEVSHVNNVWVANRRRCACFSFKARDGFTFLEIFIVENVGSNRLYCDSTRN